MRHINKHYRTVKSALKKENVSGSFLCAKYRFSPYTACEHGCLYCDGRAEKYYVDGEFDRDIVIRQNLPAVLDAQLSKLREKGMISIGSGVSDAYQPVEAGEKLMRSCAQVLSNYPYPATVLTKSSLILRDFDVWRRINEKTGFMAAISLTYADDKYRRIFEPNASPVEERLEVLRVFKSAGCAVGVLAMPFIPYIADTVEDIRRLFSLITPIGVDFIRPASLTLRPGRQKDTFLQIIQKQFPEQLSQIRSLYAEDRQSGSPLLSYRREMHHRFSRVQREHGMPYLVPHRVFKGTMQLYDEVQVLLRHMIEIYSGRGIRVQPLKNALDNYMKWLLDRKREYNRKRSWNYSVLEEELLDLTRSGKLERIIRNHKLYIFLEQIILERKVFDYVDLTCR